ncbi:hypothetical protein ACOQFL_16720 [Actinopolyspora sp. H202]
MKAPGRSAPGPRRLLWPSRLATRGASSARRSCVIIAPITGRTTPQGA